MKCRRYVTTVLAVCVLSNLAIAKTNIHDWNNVRIVELGSTIVVKTKQGEKYSGTLDFAYVDSLSIVVARPHSTPQVIKLRRDEIKEVRTKPSKIVSGAIGAGVGLGVGVGLGQIADSKDKYGEDPGLGKAVGGFLGFMFGAVIGSSIRPGTTKIYQAP